MPRLTDFQLLSRVKSLSWLLAPQKRQLLDGSPTSEVKSNGVIFGDGHPNGQDVYFLLSGRAQLVGHDGRRAGKILALVAPGIVPKPPSLPVMFNNSYRCEALSDCRVVRTSKKRFIEIALGVEIPGNVDLEETLNAVNGQLHHMLMRYPSFRGFDLATRVSIALLEMAENFGVQTTHGTLLPLDFSHENLADLVGASRPKVTLAINSLQQQNVIGRDGRRIMLKMPQLKDFIGAHA
jgi:CRP-like cAMP-binding protein